MSKLNRKIYIVMGHNYKTSVTYISEVCSSKKKADEHRNYISELMNRDEPGNYYHWVYDQRVV